MKNYALNKIRKKIREKPKFWASGILSANPRIFMIEI